MALPIFLSPCGSLSQSINAPDRLPAALVSIAGLNSVLCVLLPGANAHLQNVARAKGVLCAPKASRNQAAAVWLPTWAHPSGAVVASVRSRGEVFFGSPPLNGAISTWLSGHHSFTLSQHADKILVGAASSIDYQDRWDRPFASRRSGIFYGRAGNEPVTFAVGRVGSVLDDVPGCTRVIVPLRSGGALFLVPLQRQKATENCFAPATRALPNLPGVKLALPELELSTRSSLRSRIAGAGFEELFESKSDPLSGFGIDDALSDVAQSIRVKWDSTTIGVEASTLGSVSLGVPHAELAVTIDRPFAFRIVDRRHSNIVSGVVEDLSH